MEEPTLDPRVLDATRQDTIMTARGWTDEISRHVADELPKLDDFGRHRLASELRTSR